MDDIGIRPASNNNKQKNDESDDISLESSVETELVTLSTTSMIYLFLSGRLKTVSHSLMDDNDV
jgi:hypothetical protein